MRLAACEFGHQIAGARATVCIVGLRMHQRQRTEVVPQRVAGDGVRFPATVGGGLGIETGVQHEVVQQAVRLQAHQITAIGVQRIQKQRRRQPHLRQRHRADAAGLRSGGLGWKTQESGRHRQTAPGQKPTPRQAQCSIVHVINGVCMRHRTSLAPVGNGAVRTRLQSAVVGLALGVVAALLRRWSGKHPQHAHTPTTAPVRTSPWHAPNRTGPANRK